MKKKLVIIAILLLFLVVACESGPLFDPGTPTPIPLTETPTPREAPCGHAAPHSIKSGIYPRRQCLVMDERGRFAST
ncbi:MAG: hypothetical protein KKC71_09290 [Chloroflexi bacterium]|nr:hypothetical protein [Chloroflexota bacterium]